MYIFTFILPLSRYIACFTITAKVQEIQDKQLYSLKYKIIEHNTLRTIRSKIMQIKFLKGIHTDAILEDIFIIHMNCNTFFSTNLGHTQGHPKSSSATTLGATVNTAQMPMFSF